MQLPFETRDGRPAPGLVELKTTKAIGVGRNYREHAAELGNEVPSEPMIFMKPTTALIGPGQTIRRPPGYQRVDHEGELALVVKRRAHRVKPEDAFDFILGYTCANDVTVRDLRLPGHPWLRSKGRDTFLPIGPRVVTDLDPTDLEVVVRVDGELRQRGRTSQFVFSIPELFAFISREITLEEHDLVLTGTPAGVGNLMPGNTVEVEIEGIGILSNPVQGE